MRNTEIICADSGDYTATISDWLPEGILNCIWENWVASLNKKSIKTNKLGWWTAFQLKHNGKKY